MHLSKAGVFREGTLSMISGNDLRIIYLDVFCSPGPIPRPRTIDDPMLLCIPDFKVGCAVQRVSVCVCLWNI